MLTLDTLGEENSPKEAFDQIRRNVTFDCQVSDAGDDPGFAVRVVSWQSERFFDGRDVLIHDSVTPCQYLADSANRVHQLTIKSIQQLPAVSQRISFGSRLNTAVRPT